jgi:RHS repeat-associated protein
VASDVAHPALAGTSAAIVVSAGVASKFLVNAPANAAVGTAFLFTVTAADAYNNPVTGFSGTVGLSSSDPAANLQATSALTGGTGTFAADFNTSGRMSITITEKLRGFSGSSNSITVSDPTPGVIPAEVYNSAEAIYGNALTTDPGGNSQDTGGMVLLSDGESYLTLTGPESVGRGMNYQFTAYYRSGVQFSGPLGNNWSLGDGTRVRVVTATNLAELRLTFATAKVGDVVLLSDNRADLYAQNAAGSYTEPNGIFATLVLNSDGTYTQRDRYGTVMHFGEPDSRGIGSPITLQDREGNTLTYQYDAQGRLSTVIDTLGRPITYTYDSNGRVTDVRDFAGRNLHFTYDASGNLSSMTSPPVTGTPNGNDFPAGATTRYTYTTGFSDPLLNHKLLTITEPNEVAAGGPPTIMFTYDTNSTSPTAGYVQTLTLGGTNAGNVPAGGTITYSYQTLAAVAPGDITTPVAQTSVTDRNGNLTRYQYNSQQNIVTEVQVNNRPMRSSDPPSYTTTDTYNADYLLVSQVNPAGNTTRYVYDAGNSNSLSRGNLLSTTDTPDAGHSGDQAAITTTYTYEPIYNQVHTMTEPRGNDPAYIPQNGGAQSAARYTTTYTYDYQEGTNFAALGQIVGMTAAQVQAELSAAGIPMGIGDLDGDGPIDRVAGNLVQTVAPSVALLPGSNEAALLGTTLQPIVTRYSYNNYGQLTQTIDPEGNVTVYQYYPAQAPSGDGVIVNPSGDPVTGGYLAQTIEDAASAPGRDNGTNPPPADIRTQDLYDNVGNVIRQIDGRGIATDYVYNAWNKVVQTTVASAVNLLPPTVPEPLPLTAFGYLERYFYDYNGNLVLSQVEDHGDTSGVAGNPPASILPPTASNPNPNTGPAFVDTIYQYDILDREIGVIHVVANEPSPVFLTTRYRYDPDGNQVLTIQPEGNATSSVYDDRNLLFQQTVGATAPPLLVQLGPSDPTSYDVRGGIPATTTWSYDANGNLIQVVDPNNLRARFVYDGFDRPTAVVDGVGNETVTQYDPDGNVIRTSRFGPTGGPSPTTDGPATLPGPVSVGGMIQARDLVNSNLLSATETQYDELDRPYQTGRVLFVNTLPTTRPPDVAEGGSDVGLGSLTPGQTQPIPGISGVTILGRVSTRTEYDRVSRPSFVVQDDGNTTRTFYDGVSRVIQTQDAEGNTVQTAYDADSNVIETRQTDVSQLDGSSEIFLTTSFYDSLNRLQEQVDNLGETTYYRYDSRNNLVAEADASGPPGPAISRRAYLPGPNTNNATNLPGNVTLCYYDGLDRQVRQEQILTVSGQGDGVNIGANIYGVKGPTPPPDPTQGGGDGIIRTGTVYDANSLPSAQLDDQGNVTISLYDNLDRPVVLSRGLTVNSTLTSSSILGTRAVPAPSPATLNDPSLIAPAQIDAQLSEVQARIKAISSLFASLASSVVAPQTAITGYDPNGNVLIRIDPNNSEVFSQYDGIDRLIADRVFRVNQHDSFAGDPVFAPAPTGILADPTSTGPAAAGTTAQNFQYDGLSRRTLATDNNDPTTTADDSAVTDAYDGLGRVIEETQTTGAQKPLVITSAWRAEDLRSRVIYPNGQIENYTYDHLDRMKSVGDSGLSGQAMPAVSTTYDYLGGRLAERTSAYETQVYSYDGMGRLTSVYDEGPMLPSLIVGFTYTYDRMGDRLTQGQVTNPSANETYRYDSAYRLVSFQRPFSSLPPLQSSWILDGAGNASAINGATQQFSSSNELTRTSTGAVVQYDANGNEINDGTYTYTYDAANRLRSVTLDSTGTVLAVYSYDALGRRTEKVVTNLGTPGKTTYFVYDGALDIEDTNGAGAVQTYVFGALGEPLALDRPSGQRLLYAQNASLSTYALSTTDGILVESYQYDAYGRQTVIAGTTQTPGGASTVGNPYLFVGMRLDPETNLYYNNGSYYNSVQNRYVSQQRPICTPLPCTRVANPYLYAADSPTRDYCVQYRESDFDFASRLMEEEGIYYFFKHSGNDKLELYDYPGAYAQRFDGVEKGGSNAPVGTGEQIFTDKYGRVKVQFFWDRQGKKGSELIYIHAEKDQQINVENDEAHWVGHDRTRTIDHDEATHVKHDRTETVDNNETITIHGSRTETVDNNETITIHGNRTETVDRDGSALAFRSQELMVSELIRQRHSNRNSALQQMRAIRNMPSRASLGNELQLAMAGGLPGTCRPQGALVFQTTDLMTTSVGGTGTGGNPAAEDNTCAWSTGLCTAVTSWMVNAGSAIFHFFGA